MAIWAYPLAASMLRCASCKHTLANHTNTGGRVTCCNLGWDDTGPRKGCPCKHFVMEFVKKTAP